MGVAYAADICRLFREGDLTSAGMALRLAVDALSGFEALKVCHCHHTLEKHFCRICHRRYGEYCREEKHASECAGCTDTQGYPQCSAYREALGRGVPAEDNIPKKALGPGEPEQG